MLLDNPPHLRFSIPGFSFQNSPLCFSSVVLGLISWCYKVPAAKYTPMYFWFAQFPMPSPRCALYPASGIPQINHKVEDNRRLRTYP